MQPKNTQLFEKQKNHKKSLNCNLVKQKPVKIWNLETFKKNIRRNPHRPQMKSCMVLAERFPCLSVGDTGECFVGPGFDVG